MNNMRKWLVVLLSVIVTVLCGVAITACDSSPKWRVPEGGVVSDGYTPGEKGDFYYPEGINPDDYVDEENRYVIRTVSLGGTPISGVSVKISKNNVTVVEGISTNGEVQFGIPRDEYQISYSTIPRGFSETAKGAGTLYELDKENLSVTSAFESKVIDGTVPSTHNYALGDVMYDFTYVDADGARRNLAETLQTKKLVMLNFWYINCGPCVAEFPALEEAYQTYKNDMEIIALSTSDGATAIKNFKNNGGYSFFMVSDVSTELSKRFNVTATPTTILIDRYGIYAFRHEGNQTQAASWEALFAEFLSDDYQQNFDSTTGGDSDSTTSEPVDPPEDWDLLPSDSDLNSAFLDESMTDYQLTYYEPEEGTSDAAHNWPFHTGEENGEWYITPSNAGVTQEGISSNNSFSILYTDITLEADEKLTVELKYNTEKDADLVYIILNKSPDSYYYYSGDSNGWYEVELYSATRRTNINIALSYVKNPSQTIANEFVGLRNLKVERMDENVDEPIDVRTEIARENADTTMSYTQTYYSESDGFYHVYRQSSVQDPENDPILFANITGTTLYAERHLKGYNLTNDSGIAVIPSMYLISYWRFNPEFYNGFETDEEQSQVNGLVFDYTEDQKKNKEYSDTIIDSYWIQDSGDYAPVTQAVKEALQAFVQAVHDNRGILNFNDAAELSDDTWLELCLYYRTIGGSHSSADHLCLATYNPAIGKSPTYATELKVNEQITVDTNNGTKRNQMGGKFYKFTAPQTGVYTIYSVYPYMLGDAVDPKIVVWEPDETGYVEVFYGRPVIEMDDTLSADRWTNFSTNFKAIIYMEEGDIIYPQFTTRMSDSPGKYDVKVEFLGQTHYEFEVASTGDGAWTTDVDEQGNMGSTLYYMAVDVMLNRDDNIWYNITEDGAYGSPMYIDFTRQNFYESNGHSLKWLIDNGLFNYTEIGGDDFTSKMNGYYNQAVKKELSDPTYGMVLADNELVQMIYDFAEVHSEDGLDWNGSGVWEAFAYYYHYYGPTSWVEMS